MATESEVRRLILEVLGAEKVSELEDYVDGLNESMGGGGSGTSRRGKSKAGGGHNLQQNLTAASYALQDFTSASGDLGQKLNSISNNIPGILAGLGGFATAASALVTVGIALYKNWDAIAGLFEKGFKLPETTDHVEKFTDEIKKNRKEMEELEKQTHHTFEETEKYSQLVVKTQIAEANLAEARRTKADVAAIGRMKPEEAARGAAFVSGVKGYEDEIRNLLIGQGYTPDVAERVMSLAARGGQVSIDEITRLLPQKLRSHIQAGMPEFQAQIKAADEETKRIEEDRELSEKKRAQTLQSMEDEERELKHQQDEDKKDRTEKQQAEKHAHAEKVKAEHKSAAAAKHAASVEEQRAKHEAGLLEDAFADRAQFMAKGFMGQGFSPEQVQAKMARDFMRMGATQAGAQKAAQDQMEKVMVDITKNGGLAASLILQQGKLQHVMLDQQNQIRGQLMQAQSDLQRNWANGLRTGK